MGNPPKPVEQRIREGNPGKRPLPEPLLVCQFESGWGSGPVTQQSCRQRQGVRLGWALMLIGGGHVKPELRLWSWPARLERAVPRNRENLERDASSEEKQHATRPVATGSRHRSLISQDMKCGALGILSVGERGQRTPKELS